MLTDDLKSQQANAMMSPIKLWQQFLSFLFYWVYNHAGTEVFMLH